MPILEIKIEEKSYPLHYSVKVDKGIYCSDDPKQVEQNSKTFEVKFQPLGLDNVVETAITKFKNFSIVTQKLDTDFLQFIIFNSAAEEAVSSFMKELPEDTRHLIELARTPINTTA